MSRGVIIGKFLPPHRGHQYLIDFARNFVDELTVQICSTAAEPIPGAQRYAWMREAFGGIAGLELVHNPDENPQVPDDTPEQFWEIWRDSILNHMDTRPDYVLASEHYGVKLAEVLGARYIPVDPVRELVPISGTAIRQDPLRYWDFILPAARPWFLKRVAIVGPESSGKTTLAKTLAAHYQTCYVPEYARAYLDTVGFKFDDDTMVMLARGQRASAEALAGLANRVLIEDTECLTTLLWSEILIGAAPPGVQELAEAEQFDLYLVNKTTTAWSQDPHRFQPQRKDRETFERRCIAALVRLNRNFVCLEGDWDYRTRQAIAAIDELLGRPASWTNGRAEFEG